MNKAHKIALVVGTRPEAIKLMPVYLAMKNSAGLSPFLIITGQHGQMVNDILEFFGISPDLRLSVESGSLSILTGSLFHKLSMALDSEVPSGIIVQGDTTSAMVGAMVAFYKQIPVYHVEAGLRTYNVEEPFPEEVNRQIVARVAAINFAPTKRAEVNLKAEAGIPGKILKVGNTVVDALNLVSSIVHQRPDHYAELNSLIEPYSGVVLITGHRRENFGVRMQRILETLSQLIDEYTELLFIFPVHKNPRVKDHVDSFLKPRQNLKLIEPLPYDEMLFLMQRSKLIITDSGGIQEEAPAFQVPVVVTREQTERPEGLEKGFSFLAGSSPEDIRSICHKLLADEHIRTTLQDVPNPYGDGHASERIVSAIENALS